MAEAVDEMQMDSFTREREAQANEEVDEEEGETSFINNRPGYESVLIIDGSNPIFTRVEGSGGGEVPNIGRDVRVMKRHIIYDQKQFLKKGLGVTVNKRDGPNSTILFDELKVTTGKNNKINGATYKGKKILVLKDGKMEYSTDKTKAKLVKEFRGLLKKAHNEYKKTLAPMMEQHSSIDIEQDDEDDVAESVSNRVEDEISDRVENISSNMELTANELRELRGILNVKGNSGEAKIKALNVEIKHWKEESEREEANGNALKAKLYDAFKEIAEAIESRPN